MNLSSSAIDSSFSLLPAIPAAKPHGMTKRTLRVFVLDFLLPEQQEVISLLSLQERTRASRILLFTISNEVSEEEQKIRSIRAEAETCPGKICRRFENVSWIHAIIFALLTSCCVITFFFAFQAPFWLRTDDNRANPMTFRAEIAALPATLKSQTKSRFRAHGSQQNVGYHNAEDALNEFSRKRRMPRERPFQQKQVQVSIRAAQFCTHN